MNSTPTRRPPAVLIVEDETIVAWELERCVREFGYRVSGVADSAEEALRCVEKEVPDLALMDIRLNGPIDGIEVAATLRARFGVASIFLTANSDQGTSDRAQPTLPSGYLTKPFKPQDLKRTLELALYRHRIEREREVSARMGSLKALAGGVAHEVNNPLMAITGNLSYLQASVAELERNGGQGSPEVSELRAALAEALTGATRISAVVQDLTTFAGGQRGAGAEEADVASALAWAARATEAVWSPRAQLHTTVEPGLVAPLDQKALGQILVELLSNGAQAISPSAPGPHLLEVKAWAGDDGTVFLEVRDSGSGVSLQDQSRAFEPYFTTQAMGSGRGLGLSLCRGLVDAVGGEIRFERQPTRGGACVLVKLPRRPVTPP